MSEATHQNRSRAHNWREYEAWKRRRATGMWLFFFPVSSTRLSSTDAKNKRRRFDSPLRPFAGRGVYVFAPMTCHISPSFTAEERPSTTYFNYGRNSPLRPHFSLIIYISLPALPDFRNKCGPDPSTEMVLHLHHRTQKNRQHLRNNHCPLLV